MKTSLKTNTNQHVYIEFMKFKWLYFLLSAVVIVPGVISLLLWGLKPSIDFTGGTLVELNFTSTQAVSETLIRQAMPAGIDVASVQPTGARSYLIRTKPMSKEQNDLLQTKLASAAGSLEELRYESVGPILGQELIRKTFVAIGLAASLILLYVAYRFTDIKYGVSAVLAMFHDTLVLLGTFSLLGHFAGVEVDTLFVTAMLTILSFSVHDTIIVYDRIREQLHYRTHGDFLKVANTAVAETLSRSVNNSMTIIFMLLALWLLGGDTTKWFVFALLVGTVTGTYSSTFTAVPILTVWHEWEQRRKKAK